MTHEEIEELDKRFSLQVDFNIHRQDVDAYSKCGPMALPYNAYRIWQMKFTQPDNLTTIGSLLLMYYQFDKFMKENYGELINDYLGKEQGRRIDLTGDVE